MLGGYPAISRAGSGRTGAVGRWWESRKGVGNGALRRAAWRMVVSSREKVWGMGRPPDGGGGRRPDGGSGAAGKYGAAGRYGIAGRYGVAGKYGDVEGMGEERRGPGGGRIGP